MGLAMKVVRQSEWVGSADGKHPEVEESQIHRLLRHWFSGIHIVQSYLAKSYYNSKCFQMLYLLVNKYQ